MASAQNPACALGDCEASIAMLEESVCRQPHNYTLHYKLGVCYGGLCRNHPLVHPETAAAYLRQALRLVPKPTGVRAAILDQLAGTLLHMPGETALREAIDHHLEAAGLYRALGMAGDWSRTEYNLGNSCCDLSERTGEEHWREAIAHYLTSLEIQTWEKDANRDMAVLINLGTAYRRTGNLDRCIQCYRRALRFHAARSNPEKRASLENNLGNAILSLPEPDEKTAARNARRALRHFDRALRDSRGRALAIAQYNRAQACLRLNPDQAVECLQSAEAAFHSCGDDRYTQLVQSQLQSIRGRSG
jgi:tetratricopeptide (TPR) repeat protein